MRRIATVVVAAGEGKRFGAGKLEAILKGRPVLHWTLEAFQSHPLIAEIILVLRDRTALEEYSSCFPKISAVVQGGQERQDSVRAGVAEVDPQQTGIVLVQDGARPLVSRDLIDRIITATEKHGTAIPVIPVEDTVKRVQKSMVLETLPRKELHRVQTPQGFSTALLRKALETAGEEDFYGTDEASLVERLDKPVAAVMGEPKNIKITTPQDLKLAEVLLED